MFGGSVHKDTQKGYYKADTGEFYTGAQKDPADIAGTSVAETYHLKDHAANRLITQEGETEGKATGHYEYMGDQRANSETGEYESYALRKVYDPVGKKFMYISDGEREMEAGELAKEEGRKGAGIAPHSLSSSDGQNFSRANFAVWAKYVRDNPGFVKERMANFLVTGKTSAIDDEVVRNVELFKTKNELVMENPNFAKNLAIMWKESKETTQTVLSKFSGLNRGVVEAIKTPIIIRDMAGHEITRLDP